MAGRPPCLALQVSVPCSAVFLDQLGLPLRGCNDGISGSLSALSQDAQGALVGAGRYVSDTMTIAAEQVHAGVGLAVGWARDTAARLVGGDDAGGAGSQPTTRPPTGVQAGHAPPGTAGRAAPQYPQCFASCSPSRHHNSVVVFVLPHWHTSDHLGHWGDWGDWGVPGWGLSGWGPRFGDNAFVVRACVWGGGEQCFPTQSAQHSQPVPVCVEKGGGVG